MVSMLLHQLHPKPPNVTHARLSNHVALPGLLGWSNSATKRYPQHGFSVGTFFRKRPLLTKRSTCKRFTANLPANAGHAEDNQTLHTQSYLRTRRAICPEPYARRHMPGAICTETHVRNHMPKDISRLILSPPGGIPNLNRDPCRDLLRLPHINLSRDS